MEFAFRFLLVILLLGSLEVSQSAYQGAKQPQAKQSELEIVTRVMEHKYCSASSMVLTLELEYKNVGKQNLIVIKYALPPFDYRVSQNSKAASQKRYEQVMTLMVSRDNRLVQFGDKPSSDYFVTLEPGQSYSPENPVKIPVTIAEGRKDISEDYLRPGEHVLQLNISTWPFSNTLEEDLRTRWHRFGYVWSKDVLTTPTTFQVGKFQERPLSNCN